MQWSKAKTVIIALLLLVNLFLLWRLAVVRLEEGFVSAELAAAASNALADSGIIISPEVFPRARPDISTLIFDLDIDSFRALAAETLTPEGGESFEISLIEEADGGVKYSSPKGELYAYSDGSFELLLNSAAEGKVLSERAAVSAAKRLISESGIKADTLQALPTQKAESGYTVTLVQAFGGIPVCGYYTQVRIERETILWAKGRLLISAPSSELYGELRDSVNAIFSVAAILSDELLPFEISSMRLCYYPLQSGDGARLTLLPSYRITTARGEYCFDLSGARLYPLEDER